MPIGPLETNFNEIFNQNTKSFIHENTSEYIISNMAAILSRGRWVNIGEYAVSTLNTHLILPRIYRILPYAVLKQPRCLVYILWLLTHWGWDKMTDIFQTAFSMFFLVLKCFDFYHNFTDICSRGQIINFPALVQIMAWHHQATSHYLSQWWPSLLRHICVTRP